MFMTEYDEAKTREAFREEGREEGREQGREEERISNIIHIMNTLKYSAAQAMDLLGIPDEERAYYQARCEERAAASKGV